MFDLTGKVALVTGSSRGIGKSIALALAKQGADIIINDLPDNTLSYETANLILTLGRKCKVFGADVTDEHQVNNMFQFVKDTFGKLDILVNNAGISQSKDIFEMEFSDWKRIMKVNLDSAFLCSKYAMAMMKEQKSGRIISLASQAGERGALFGHVHYAASKSGILAMNKTLARTGAPYNITVNSIAPGVIFTDFTKAVHTQEEVDELAASIPLGLGNPDDVAAAVVYLASDEARYVTGATLDVNGGSHIH